MKVVKKLFSALMLVVMVVAILPLSNLQAKEIKLAVPKVKISTIKNGTVVQIEISKTKDAEGFEIYASSSGSMYDCYGEYVNDNSVCLEGYRLVDIVEKDGKKKRTVEINSFSSGNYEIAVRAFNSKKYGTKLFSDLSKANPVTVKDGTKGYKKKYNFSKVKKGDIVKFGAFEQDADYTDGKEAIEWIVLKKSKTSVLLLSKYILDCLPYNNTFDSVTWETCTLRKWLNEEFYKRAFNDKEKQMINTTTLDNFDNVVSGTSGGNDTKDKVFLLSQLEMISKDYGFDESYDSYDISRRCTATAYAVEQGAENSTADQPEYNTESGDGTFPWWLRTSGYTNQHASLVYYTGAVSYYGAYVYGKKGVFSAHLYGVRPAICIKLKS